MEPHHGDMKKDQFVFLKIKVFFTFLETWGRWGCDVIIKYKIIFGFHRIMFKSELS